MSKVRLGDICDALSDGLHAAPVFTPGGKYLFVNAINLENGRIVEKGDVKRSDENEYQKYAIDLNERTILYSIDGTIGNIAKYRGEDVILGKGACYIKLNQTVDVDYIYFLLQSDHFKGYLKSMQTGSTIHHISLETMRNYPLPDLPPLDEQHRIAGVLSAIDDKIENNRKLMAELEATARLVYDEWFVRFDFPDEQGRPYRSSGGKMVWNDELKQEIPLGWEAGSINQLGSIISGATPSTDVPENYANGAIAWITPNDLSKLGSSIFVWSGERNISERGLASCSAQLMPAGSVLMSSRAPIGYLAIAAKDCCTNQGCKSLVTDKGFGSLFIYFSLKHFMPLIESQGAGTTFKEVSGSVLGSVRLPLPSLNLASSFEESIAPLLNREKATEREVSGLISLRDWLLPMLMNGQVKVG